MQNFCHPCQWSFKFRSNWFCFKNFCQRFIYHKCFNHLHQYNFNLNTQKIFWVIKFDSVQYRTEKHLSVNQTFIKKKMSHVKFKLDHELSMDWASLKTRNLEPCLVTFKAFWFDQCYPSLIPKNCFLWGKSTII
jgi:hypothetical protein